MSYVAIVSGEVLYDGRLEPITAGVTYIAEGHEIVRRFPHMFKRAATTRPTRTGVRSAKRTAVASASAPAQAATRRVVDVSLVRHRTPRFEVKLTPDLVWSIEREIGATLGTYGIVETGGYLVSHRSDYVGIQTGPGPKSTHGPGRFRLDQAAAAKWLHDPLLHANSSDKMAGGDMTRSRGTQGAPREHPRHPRHT